MLIIVLALILTAQTIIVAVLFRLNRRCDLNRDLALEQHALLDDRVDQLERRLERARKLL